MRFKAAIVTDLLSNADKLAAERKKAESMRGIRLQAVSHEDAHKQVESQWSSVEREKQEKTQKEQAAKAAVRTLAPAAATAAAVHHCGITAASLTRSLPCTVCDCVRLVVGCP